ncbi:hypothetical protein [Nocardia miyunensis]|uniref:hypothetical protein n=1 Tax=Nocardia miyunensis TaxID=282684 RepID=UPI0012F507C6|nr:hypothetical protein [Nocardia miyunensis]
MTGRHAYIVPVIVPTGDGGRVAARAATTSGELSSDPDAFAARIRARLGPGPAHRADRSRQRLL